MKEVVVPASTKPPRQGSPELSTQRGPGGAESFVAEGCLLFPKSFHVVEEFQEHDPGEHGQAVKVAIQALVFAHDVPARFHNTAQ